MKIGFIIDNLYGGGAERAEINIMNALSEHHDITAIVYRNYNEEKNYSLRSEVRLVYINPRFPTDSPLAYLNWAERIIRMKQIRKQERFDVVISFLDGGNAYNVLTACGEKTVISVRNLISKSGKHRVPSIISPDHVFIQTAARRLQNRADIIICVSEDVARDQIQFFHADIRKTKVIQNFVDAEMVRCWAERKNSDCDFLRFVASHDVLFGNSGRLAYQKGQWHLIKAFSEVVREYPGAGLFIVGEGKLEKLLKEAIRDYGLEGNVMLCGYQTNPMQYLKYADWLVHSALYEGMSNTVLEAMALGLPVICTDCAGTRELLTPERPYGETVKTLLFGDYGIICRLDEDRNNLRSSRMTESEQDLALAMNHVIENPALKEQYEKASLERVKAFSKEIKITEWEAIIKETVSKSKEQ